VDVSGTCLTNAPLCIEIVQAKEAKQSNVVLGVIQATLIHRLGVSHILYKYVAKWHSAYVQSTKGKCHYPFTFSVVLINYRRPVVK